MTGSERTNTALDELSLSTHEISKLATDIAASVSRLGDAIKDLASIVHRQNQIVRVTAARNTITSAWKNISDAISEADTEALNKIILEVGEGAGGTKSVLDLLSDMNRAFMDTGFDNIPPLVPDLLKSSSGKLGSFKQDDFSYSVREFEQEVKSWLIPLFTLQRLGTALVLVYQLQRPAKDSSWDRNATLKRVYKESEGSISQWTKVFDDFLDTRRVAYKTILNETGRQARGVKPRNWVLVTPGGKLDGDYEENRRGWVEEHGIWRVTLRDDGSWSFQSWRRFWWQTEQWKSSEGKWTDQNNA